MKFHADCAVCLMNSALKKVSNLSDEPRKLEFIQGICHILENANGDYDSAPLVDARIIQLKRELLHMEDDYTEVKHCFNQMMLGLYERLRAQVRAADDPLYAAIQLAMAGNYIDFGVLGNICPDDALRMLEEASQKKVDAEEYARLRADLAKDGELVYLHDNCGEVVLDKLLIETIRSAYPHKKVVSMVRGTPILNDATIEDAREVNLFEVAEVMENGLKDIAGTQMDMLPEHVRRRIENADLVIAKGQGNFETLMDCGLNVYFLFLSKCASYTQWFGFERFSGILKNAKRMENGVNACAEA